jgi:hypothetical protein
MNSIFFVILILLSVALLFYVIVYFVLSKRLTKQENAVIQVFLAKISKIPALIEVMRPYVADPQAFASIINLHSEAMIRRYDTLYDLLEQNARIEHEFSFLMKLSMQIPLLQKDEYFLYIRDFIIRYERDMRSHFSGVNTAVDHWNRFIMIKNMSMVGLALPGKEKMNIV